MKKPFISIILPNYNHAKYLPESIESVLNQSFKDYELLIIDDASSDNSIEIIKKYQKETPNIRLIQNQKNLGISVNIKKAIELSQGEYLSFFAADDIMFKKFLNDVSTIAIQHPNLGILCGNLCEFEDKKPYNFILKDCGFKNKNYIFSSSEIIKILRQTKFYIPSHVSIYKKQAVISCGGYIDELKSISDWFLNYKIAFTYGVGYIPKSLGAMRIVKTSYAHTYMSYKKTRDLMYIHLFHLLSLETPKIRRAFQKSALIGEFGLRMVEYLIHNPKYWSYLPRIVSEIPAMLIKKFKKEISKIKSKIS